MLIVAFVMGFLGHFPPVKQLLVLENAVNDPRSKSRNVMHGGEFSWRQHHARVGVDGQRQQDIHVHVVEPIVISLRDNAIVVTTLHS
jgi:hypothetical protein